jgi:hypothetical protein
VEREVSGFFGLAGAPVRVVRFVVLRKQEENDALRAAHQYVKQQAAGNDSAANDPDMMIDAKCVECLFRSCKDPTSGRSAFPGPQWMRDNMTGDQIAVLMNVYNEVRAKCGPIDYRLDREHIDAIVSSCARAAGTDLPDLVLERFPREVLTSLVVLLSQEIVTMREAPVDEPTDEPADEPPPQDADAVGPVDTEAT